MSKCLYCENMTDDPHFESDCCGRGMCDDCYYNDQGTEEQWQISYMDDEDWNKFIKGTKYEQSEYVCFECVDKGRVGRWWIRLYNKVRRLFRR